MTNFCPAYPTPRVAKSSALRHFFGARHSWIDGLFERSYRMQMGEVHLPGKHLYMVNDPSLVRQILVHQSAEFPKSPLLGEALAPLLGHSVLTTNAAQWQRQRAMMQPAFAQGRLQAALPAMERACADMMIRLAAHPVGQACDMEREMTHVTADVMFRTIFSQPVESDDAKQVFDAFARFQTLAPRLMLPVMYGVRWLKWPVTTWRSHQAAREIRSLLGRLVRPRYDAAQVGTVGVEDDVLSAFLAARDPIDGTPFSFDELLDQIATLFLAGHETSASALSWAMHLLAHSPTVQERMAVEATTLQRDRAVKAGDLKQLELTWNVFRETLRLFPPVGFLPRQAAQTCPMRDKTVPKGASVMISPWLIQRHRTFWDRPDEFDPDRYADDQSRESLRAAYLPFGLGPRACIGATFALQEAVLILARVVGHFHIEPVTDHVPQPVGRLTIRSANGIQVLLRSRAAAVGNVT